MAGSNLPAVLKYGTSPPADSILAAIPDGMVPDTASPVVSSRTITHVPQDSTAIPSPSPIPPVSHSIGDNPLLTAFR